MERKVTPRASIPERAEKSRASREERRQKREAKQAAQQKLISDEINKAMSERIESLKLVGAEDYEIDAVKVVFELLGTASLVSMIRFGEPGADPGLVIATYDRIVAQAEIRQRISKPYG